MGTELDTTTKTGISYKNIAISDTGGGGRLMPQTFGEIIAFSEMMSRAKHAIPAHLRDVPGACMAVTMQAMRWDMDPFVVASKSYVVGQGMIAYEAQLVAALINTRAPIAAEPIYSFDGEGPTLKCSISVLMRSGNTLPYDSPMVKDIKVQNSPLWKADPRQQLGYYSIRMWARRHTPEVILGVYTPDERDQMREYEPRDVTPPKPTLVERLAGTSGASIVEHINRETGEITTATKSENDADLSTEPTITEATTEAQDGQDASEATKDAPDNEEPATDAAATEDDADKWVEDTLLDLARSKAVEGGRTWRMFKGGLTVEQQKELADHMKELEKLAKAA